MKKTLINTLREFNMNRLIFLERIKYFIHQILDKNIIHKSIK